MNAVECGAVALDQKISSQKLAARAGQAETSKFKSLQSNFEHDALMIHAAAICRPVDVAQIIEDQCSGKSSITAGKSEERIQLPCPRNL